MMTDNPSAVPAVYIVSDDITSPLGFNTIENVTALLNGKSGIRLVNNQAVSKLPIMAALFDDELKSNPIYSSIEDTYTKFEKLLITSITNALDIDNNKYLDEETILIVSSTKGNISLLETEEHTDALNNRIALHTSAQLIADYFGFKNKPIVVSNACISGVMAVLTGVRLIESGQYKNAVVAGADVISQFVASGFQSFQALSQDVCRPFDEGRTGLNLGEGAATIILSSQKNKPDDIRVTGGAISNDANHISGPSRTGEELGFAIKQALLNAGITASDIDYISAHGTATNYNDEMEANAIHFAGLQDVPVNSLKANFGHTLGAAGLIESIIATQSIKQGMILPSAGFEENGVSKPLNVVTSLTNKRLTHVLKTASGFGGCNAAIVYSK